MAGLRTRGATLTVSVVLKPNARRAAVVGDGGTLRVSVKSPPVDGRANAEAAELLAGEFGVPKSRVKLLKGARARTKRFEIDGATALPPGFDPDGAGR